MKNLCEFYLCIRHVLRISRWFGLLPIEGLNNLASKKSRFNLRSAYSVFIIPTALCICVNLCFSLCAAVKYNMSMVSLIMFVFSLQCASTMLLTFRVARHWSGLMQAAWETERELRGLRTTKNIPRKCAALTYISMIMALVEYIFNCIFKFQQVNCSANADFTTSFQKFVRNKLLDIFDFIPYNIWIGIYAEIVCVQKTFLWSFGDVLISCISVYLTSFFNDFGSAVGSRKTKDWRHLRRCYSRLVVFVNKINSLFGGFILVSAMNNLFFICIQCYSSFSYYSRHEKSLHKFCDTDISEIKERNLETYQKLYFIYSFIFLILRSMMILHLSANVHRAATAAASNVYQASSFDYDIEVERFLQQVRYTDIGLSGIFFQVERTMIMKVIATLITYELVMLQMNH